MSKKGLYALVVVIFVMGHALLIYCLLNPVNCTPIGICPFKAMVGLPCPSCGSTRAVLTMLNGDPVAALLTNPLGIITYTVGCLASFTIVVDWLTDKSTFYHWYLWMERRVIVKPYAYFFILIVIMNWIWNITKGL